jgi:ribosomal protein L37AE/L43A
VSETVAIGGIPVKLVDTAGIRDALDEAESIGIRKSMEALADADLVLVVLDASQGETAEDAELLRLAEKPAGDCGGKQERLGSSGQWSVASGQKVLTSAVNGEGIAELRGGFCGMLAARRIAGGIWISDQRSASGIDSGFAGGAGRGEELLWPESAARDAAARSLQRAASAGCNYGRDYDRRHSEFDLQYVLHWEVIQDPSEYKHQ